MTTTAKNKKYWKVPLILLGGIGLLLLAFHFWFVHHAESLVEDLVRRQSNGKVELRVKNFKFNWFSRKMELEQATFFTTDTSASAAYLFAVKKIKVQVQSVWPLLMDKKFLIDSLQLFDPDISVTRKANAARSADADSSLSIPQEMGRIYNSIQDALQALQVDRFQIFNGSFSLSNQANPQEIPVRISRIDLQLDNLRIDSTAPHSEQKILFSDNVALETHQQDILFPDGRHRLAFRDFRINLQNRLVEFDSCTIEARRGDSSANSFRIFFDKLQMTNIDFDTLYHAEVIKADSVYAYNPRIQLNVELAENSPVAPPRLDELMQQLTGQLDIDFVVVENGSFDINTTRAGRPTSFTSTDNNFSIQGLKVMDDGERPVSIEKFEMAIRNYENFIRDSAYAIQFDSIIVNDNRISLSNFAYSELEPGRRYNQLRMRQLELYGLSWDDLVFDKRLRAEQVTLIRPDIRYDIANARKNNRRDIFDILTGLSKALQLQRMHIVQGEINLKLPGQSSITLKDATVLLETKQLLQATSARDLRDAIQYLDFQKGNFIMKDWNIDLRNAQFIGGQNKASADYMQVKRGDHLQLNANRMEAPLLVFDEYMRLQAVHGLSWDTARLRMHMTKTGADIAIPGLELTSIKGNSTRLSISHENGIIDGLLKKFRVAEWKSDSKNVSLAGIGFSLSQLIASNNNTKISVDNWEESEENLSVITGLHFKDFTGDDSTEIKVPLVKARFLWNDWLRGQQKLDLLSLHQPVIRIQQTETDNQAGKADSFFVSQLQIVQPDIVFIKKGTEGNSRFEWKGHTDDSLSLDNFNFGTGKMPSLSADAIRFHLQGMEHRSSKGKQFKTGRGLLKGELRRIWAHRNDLGSWDWKGTVQHLQARDFAWDSLGKQNGKLWLQSADVHELRLQTSTLISMPELVKQNPNLRISGFTGSYTNNLNQYYWNNIGYNNKSKILLLDSFRYTPTEDLAAFTRRQQYQTDYMKGYTGRISIGPLELESFARDTVLSIGTLLVEDGYLDDYRDKRIPREPGIVRALPGDLLRKIPFRFRSDTIRVVNAKVRYEEMDEKTNKAGSIEVTELNGRITQARNYDHKQTDSLRIYAQGKLADEIPTRLWVKESYTDSLGGFRMRVEMDKGDLTILNPILVALANAELKSGNLDSLRMDVQGRESFAYGNMKIYYDNLKVRVIREKPRSIGTRLINFFANTIIQNRSKGKGNTVYVKRLRDRSAINYLVKITLSGIMTNVGIKKPVKQARKNRKEIKAMMKGRERVEG